MTRPVPAAGGGRGPDGGPDGGPGGGLAGGFAGGFGGLGGAGALRAMLEARSVAIVGATPRPGSFGQRMVGEMSRSPSAPRTYLVNPRYSDIGGTRCLPSLAEVPAPADLVLLGVPDAALEEQLGLAAARGDRSAVIFGTAYEPLVPEVPHLRVRLAAIAAGAGMALCGAGCMGFVNVVHGLRAVGYTEPDPLPRGPIALVTHSGSVFSTLLRTRRALGFTLAVSSGQELVTAAAAYARYALDLAQTRVLALVLEAVRQPDLLRLVLAGAAERDLPVVLLTAGSSASGRAMVAAHSGALAADDGGWEALADAYGVHRVHDLNEMADTLELFAIGRRAARVTRTRHGQILAGQQAGASQAGWRASTRASTQGSTQPGEHAGGQDFGMDTERAGGQGIATVHDSGLERAHAADLAQHLGVPFAEIGEATRGRLTGLLDPGLEPVNPLDIWGTGAQPKNLLAGSLLALADDPAVAVVALAVDLVEEFDGDRSYPLAVLDAARRTTKPLVVLSGLAGAVDPDVAAELRRAGVPVLEGLRTGLLALRHLLDHASRDPRTPGASTGLTGHEGHDATRRNRAARLLKAGTGGARLFELVREYGIQTTRNIPAASVGEALAAATDVGYPVVLKTDEPAFPHKSDVGGVVTGIPGPAELSAAYHDLSARLGPRALVCETAPPGVELAIGIARDRDLGPLVVAGAGGVLVELLTDRAIALPPVGHEHALRMLARLRVHRLLAGLRGRPAADLGAVAGAIVALSHLARELGGELEALDLNPLICGPAGAVAADVLAVPRSQQT